MGIAKKAITAIVCVAVLTLWFSLIPSPRLHQLYQSDVVAHSRTADSAAAKVIEEGFKKKGIPFDADQRAFLKFSDPPLVDVIVGNHGPVGQFVYRDGRLKIDDGAGAPWFEVTYHSKEHLEADGLTFRPLP